MESKEFSYWSIPADDAIKGLSSSINGLSSQEASRRLKEMGENVLASKKKTSELLIFLNQFKTPIVLILVVATIISALSGEWLDAFIIFLIVLSSSLISYFQERRASTALEKLRETVQVTTQVLRDGSWIPVPSRLLVAGDVVRISTGSLIPADGLILEAMDLQVNQAILTGESLPISKQPGSLGEETALKDRANCVYMGTNVHNGSATVLLTKTGSSTAFGEIAKKLTLRPPETEFERGIRTFGGFLTQIMLVLVLIVFAINVLLLKPPIDSLLFSVALAVGISPELLPAIISLTLSQGSHVMAKEGVIVKRLNAIENFGSMDILCTDKTGTLTEGVIRIDGGYDLSGHPSDEVYRMAYLNAFFQAGMANSLDDAIVKGRPPEMTGVTKIDEIPFDFDRERLSVIVKDGGQNLLLTKGAIQSVLSISTHVLDGQEAVKLDEGHLQRIQEQYAEWSRQGIRVLAVACRVVPQQADYGIPDETDMIFAGFLLMYDHPKEDVAQTIRDLSVHGISLCLITGDNKLIAVHTAESVGLTVTGVLTGGELRSLSDESFWHRVDQINIFCEVDPNQKERIILALKKKSHVVGFLGDGINDVPALHAADVSISVNNAADIAKETADLVLLEHKLEVLDRGVILGRTTFHNTLKYIQITTSANFGNMVSMAGLSLFLPFLPLLPKQILLLNFLSDIPAIAIAQDYVDQDSLKSPQRWDIHFIRNFMFLFGLISSVFDYITFGVLLLIIKANEALFQSSWFTVSVLTELLILMVMRTRRTFYKSRPAPIMIFASLAVGVFTLVVPYLPFASALGITPVPPYLLLALLFITFCYLVATEFGKRWFYRK